MAESERDSRELRILLLEASEGELRDLEDRVAALGAETVRVHTLEDAELAVSQRTRLIGAVLVSARLADRHLKASLRRLRRLGPSTELVFIAVGTPPERGERRRLRSAGVELALWEPFDAGTLRFQLNRAAHRDLDDAARCEGRVPAHLGARVVVGDRAKEAEVYSLSRRGAFLETPRASMPGALATIEIRLPERTLHLRGRVRFANAAGNLQRPNLPLGIGVAFEELPPEDGKLLQRYVAARRAQLEV